jgi:hypothetical protein
VVGQLIGGMAQNFEYQKLIEVHPRYTGLENQTVAVAVDLDMMTSYEHPSVALNIAVNVSRRIRENVKGVTVVSATSVADWQYRTPHWNSMAYGEIAETLGVDRVVLIDIYEYRLHPPGNQWLWEGVCVANVGIIERDAFDPDNFVDVFTIEETYPKISGVGRENASERAIETGLLTHFVQKAAWLFFRHFEPKHPDKYQGPPPSQVDDPREKKKKK